MRWPTPFARPDGAVPDGVLPGHGSQHVHAGHANPSFTHPGNSEEAQLQAALEASELEAALAESRRLASQVQPSVQNQTQTAQQHAQHVEVMEAALALSLAEAQAGGREPASLWTPVLDGHRLHPDRSPSASDERMARIMQQAELDHAAAQRRRLSATASSSSPAPPPIRHAQQHAAHAGPISSMPGSSRPAASPGLYPQPSTAQGNPSSSSGILLSGPRNLQPAPVGWDPYADNTPGSGQSGAPSAPPVSNFAGPPSRPPAFPLNGLAHHPHIHQHSNPLYEGPVGNAGAFPPISNSRPILQPPPQQPRTDNDEAIARALQEQLDREPDAAPSAFPQPPTTVPTSSLHSPGSLPQIPGPGRPTQPSQQPLPSLADIPRNVCAGCGRQLGMWGPFQRERQLEALGRTWHLGCLKCTGCGESLGEGSFSIGKDNQPYHRACHKQRFHPRCCVCTDFIPAQGDGLIMAMQLPFWRDKFCPAHAKDGTPKCCGCARLRPLGQQWVEVQPGRHLCLSCLESIVVDTNDAQPLYDKVLHFYAGHGLRLPERPPLLLVDSATLGDAGTRENQAHQHGSSSQHNHAEPGAAVFHTLGLTLLQEYRGMRTVFRPSGRAGANGRAAPFWQTVPELVHIPTGSSRCEVTAILILFGLPWLLTGSIIAHEVMHAWLRTNGFRDLPPEIEEGLCQLMALLWLESLPAEPEGTWEDRLSSFCSNHIRTDSSPVYGDGFRAALEAFQNVGLPNLLEHIRRTGQFPL